ncbi:hypothetical protein RDI58_007403 [Solanum bulbocastanum]|uniref:Uncharacterized protein n=1 Tax=Solanum bulbocastanum TaxID=147425 RepID=A0AAN8TV00_SOLBU
MTIVEFVVAGGDYMGVWEETPKSSYCKSFSKTIVPIAFRRNDSYDDMIASVIEAVDVEDQPVDVEDFEHLDEVQGELELRSIPNHSFSDGTNF